MQKIKQLHSKKAKKIFLEYLSSHNIFEKTKDKLIEIKNKYPNTFSKEINFMIDNVENFFITPPKMFDKIIKNLPEINNEIKYILLGLSLNNSSYYMTSEIKKYFTNLYFGFTTRPRGFSSDLLKVFGLKCCPYCNLFKLDSKIGGLSYEIMHLDHFYNRALYPYFSVSLYNFIPCCATCNSCYKREKDFFEIKHINPHFESFDSAVKFSFEMINQDIFSENQSFYICFSAKNSRKLSFQKALNCIETFDLVKRYNKEFPTILNIFYSRFLYNQDKIDEIFDLFEECNVKNISKSDIKKYAYGKFLTNKNDLNQNVFSKIINDIENMVNET